LAAVPSIGRASRVEGAAPAEAELTRALYEQYANQIFRYCLHQLGSREEAEDAVQSTFLNAFRGIKRGIVPELESAWLFKIAHNVCLSRRRSSWRRGRVESPADFEVVEELAPAPSRRADELIGLQDVLEEMPEGQRRAILLREWQGLSYREIADELELSQAAVETLIFRARRTLASGLERPPERRRVARAADWGNVVPALKSLLVGGSAAAKVAATVAAVSATTVVAAEPIQHYRTARHHPAPARVSAQPESRTSVPKRTTRVAAAATVASPAAPVNRHRKAAAAPAWSHRRHAAKAKAAVSAAAAPAQPVLTPVAPAPQEPAVEQAPPVVHAPSQSAERQAAKAGKQQAKADRKAAKARTHGGPQAPAQPQQPASTGTNSGGTNSAGKAKTHGRWARATPTLASTPALPAPVDPAPAGTVQPVDVPEGGKALGKDK